MSQPINALVKKWRNESETLRYRYSDERLASLCESHARELEVALRTSLSRQVTLNRAAEISGYSKSHLRRLMDQGTIPNVGEPGAPRVRVSDLPFKTGKMTTGRLLRAEDEERPEPGVRRISASE